MTETGVDSDDARRAIALVCDETVDSVRVVEDGVNDTFVASGSDRLVCKFATYSRARSFRAGVAAYRLLGLHTELPVPTVYGLRTDPPGMPAFHVTEYLSGSPLVEPSEPAGPGELAAVRALGAVLASFASVPDGAVDGYGTLRNTRAGGVCEGVVAADDDWAGWLVAYCSTLYTEMPDHDRLAAVAPAVPDYLRANSDRLPPAPDPSVVVTDFGPSNLLAPNGEMSGNGTVAHLTGVLDLERATIGPVAFAAVNAEYLLTRGVENPDPLVAALYDPLPFGPDLPRRDLYRLVSLGRSVHALDLWHEPGSEEHRRRGDAVATELDSLLG